MLDEKNNTGIECRALWIPGSDLYLYGFSLNSYSYQPSEYVGTGEVAYSSEGMPFGPTGPTLETTTSGGDGRATPTGTDHPPTDREYKFSTEEDRHSPCDENNLPPRSPTH